MGNPEDLASKMTLLAGDPELRLRMGTAARHRMETHFSIAQHNRQLLKIYHRLLSKEPA